MEDAFLCGKDAVMLLQAKLVELRSKGANPNVSQISKQQITRTISVYLSQLQLVHAAVREFLLHLAAKPTDTSAATKLLETLKSVAGEVPGLEALENGSPGHLAAHVRQLRAAKLEADIQALRTAAKALPTYIPVQPDPLEVVVRSLSEQEQSLDFHVRLAKDVWEHFGGGADDYSAENFSYGSTPYTSWLEVMTAIGDALKSAMSSPTPPNREYVVWGSSCGWLVLYGALTYGWRSRGVELLSFMHNCAERVAEEQAAALARTAGVRFTCGDLLQDNVSAAGLVVLADQCWDDQLAAASAAKLARELPTGALCVSYNGGLFLRGSNGGSNGGAGDGDISSGVGLGCTFKEIAMVCAPVSWNEAQMFRVFQKL